MHRNNNRLKNLPRSFIVVGVHHPSSTTFTFMDQLMIHMIQHLHMIILSKYSREGRTLRLHERTQIEREKKLDRIT